MSNNLKITITGGCGTGKTVLAVAIAQSLAARGILAELSPSVIDASEPLYDAELTQGGLNAIIARGGRIEIHGETSRRNVDPLA